MLQYNKYKIPAINRKKCKILVDILRVYYIIYQFTINVQKSHRQPQFTLHLVCEYPFFLRLIWSSRLFTRATAASKMRASISSGVSTFLSQTFPFIQQTKSNGIKSAESNRSISLTVQSHTHVRINLISQWTHVPKYLPFFLEHPVY